MADDTDENLESQKTLQESVHPTITAPLESTNNENATPVPPRATSKSPSLIPPLSTQSPTKTANLDSQPMTTTSSSSSILPLQLTNSTDPSPYGTRSRNRTGNSRPNYAEDRELDMEYEWSSTKKGHALLDSAQSYTQIDDNEKPLGVNTRRSSTTASTAATGKTVPSSSSKDYIPGTSSFSLHPDITRASQAPSKKRKAPGSTTVNVSGTGQSTAYASSRRTLAAVHSPSASRETNMMTFDSCQGYLKNGKLKADDGTIIALNDHVYLVSEPPGEPYYLARVMEFLHAGNDPSMPIESLRVNWFYRPRDMHRKVNDTRVVFATMHSDTSPLTSLRGRCRILHRNDIDDLDEYRKTKDCFWFEKMFERHFIRYYEVIPTIQVINVPERVKKVLDERWKFVIVEIGRGKELTSAIKTCKRCVGYCASNDSVDCAMCKNTYHMNCVRPPLLKKPARGFAWSCGPCSRKQERKLEARNTPNVRERSREVDDEELLDEEDDERGVISDPTNVSSPSDPDIQTSGARPATAEQVAQAKLWPYRYLGIHCKVEDALDYDDRIYPRASSRLGPRHQANVSIWHGRPVELVKPADIKKRYMKGSSHKKDAKLSKETVAALEADKLTRERRPKWVTDEPPGYVHRGEDHPNNDLKNTAKLQFTLLRTQEPSVRGQDESSSASVMSEQRLTIIDDYMSRAKEVAKAVGVPEYSTNFLDKALEVLCSNNYMMEPALEQLRKVNRRKDLKNPELNKEELKRFEEGVLRYGSELQNVSRHVGKSQKHAEIVRFYYMWKKTDRGKQIWGQFEGRKGKKQAKQVDSKLVDDVADDIDDSAFDNEKATARKRGFECKFCATRKSPQWRRAPGTAPGTTVPADPNSKSSRDKGVHLMLALCQRCAGLWRKYGIQWENIDEVAKKVAQGGGRAWKRRIDEELLIELVSANEANSIGMSSAAAAAAASVGVEVSPGLTIQPGQENPKKKQKTGFEKDTPQVAQSGVYNEPLKKKIIEKPPEPPLVPEQPKIRELPCAVCREMEPTGDQHLSCRHCRLAVHRNCYGVAQDRSTSSWLCDMCSNDNSTLFSTSYECILCPVRDTDHELMEPIKVSHKKKNDREREKEQLERELVKEQTEQYNKKQKAKGRPEFPHEALKRTVANNWVHVICALFHPEIKFGESWSLAPSVLFHTIPLPRYEQVCTLCKTNSGACVTCHQCEAKFHVACAQQQDYTFGFDVTPVKSSRRDAVSTVSLGSEFGQVTAVIFCKGHTIKSTVHPLSEMMENPTLNALQIFACNYKQADKSSSGTVRKAANINTSARLTAQVTASNTNTRGSASNWGGGSNGNSASAPASRSSRVSPAAVTVKSEEVDEDGDRIIHLSDTTIDEPVSKECITCGTDASPRWHKMRPKPTLVSHSPPGADIDAEAPQDPPRLHDALPNGHVNVNGDDNYYHDVSNARTLAPRPEAFSRTNGILGNDNESFTEPSARTTDAIMASPTIAKGDESIAAAVSLTYQCHKCHLKKPPDPSPRRSVSAQPEVIHLESHSHPAPDTIALPHSAWHPGPSTPSHNQYHGWSNQPVPQTAGPVQMSNGLSHSPPPNRPAPSHYAPPISTQYHNPGYGHAHHQHDQPIQHQLISAASPYRMQRNSAGRITTMLYSQSSGNAPDFPPIPNGTRSPPVHNQSVHSPQMNHQPTHGPQGPPRAAENPFLVPYQNQSPPRQQIPNIFDSPHTIYDRPETPTEGIGRNGGWPSSDGQLTNGASASPSLRNLLH